MDLSIAAIVILGISLLLLVMLSGIFSASETAYTSITNYQYESFYKKKKKNWVFKINTKLLNNFSMTLSTILIANTLVNVAASTLSALFFTAILEQNGVGEADSIATGVATAAITLMILVFGEFLPKSFARKYSIQYVQFIGIFIYCLYIFFFPCSWVLNKIIKPHKTKTATEDEIDTLIDIVANEGVLQNTEASLISKSLQFDDKKINTVFTKKEKMVWVDYKVTKKKLIKVFNESSLSRIPVKKNGNYIGFIDLKTVMKTLTDDQPLKIDEMVKPLLKVSQYQSLEAVFREMQISQIHMALVKKNQNSNAILGIVTMEDILEFLVGEIHDEHDIKEAVTKINDFTWKVIGTYNANKFIHETIKLPIEVDEKTTVSEWIKSEFNIEKIEDQREYKKDEFTVTTRIKNKNTFFIVEKEMTTF